MNDTGPKHPDLQEYLASRPGNPASKQYDERDLRQHVQLFQETEISPDPARIDVPYSSKVAIAQRELVGYGKSVAPKEFDRRTGESKWRQGVRGIVERAVKRLRDGESFFQPTAPIQAGVAEEPSKEPAAEAVAEVSAMSDALTAQDFAVLGDTTLLPKDEELPSVPERRKMTVIELGQREDELIAMRSRNVNASEGVRKAILLELKFVRIQLCCTDNKLKELKNKPSVLHYQIRRLEAILEEAQNYPHIRPEVQASLDELKALQSSITPIKQTVASPDTIRSRGH